MEKELSDLQLDLIELKQILAKASRPNVRKLIHDEIDKVQTIVNKEIKIVEKEKETHTNSSSQNKPESGNYFDVISKYAWDQETSGYVKVFITCFQKVGELPKENIIAKFEPESLDLQILGYQGKNHRLNVKKLNGKIDPAKSKCTVKPNTIILSLYKDGAKQWDALQYKESPFKPDKMDKSKDPQASLMDMMKNLYETGDEDMKRTIAQAWSKSHDKGDKNMPTFQFYLVNQYQY